jgi:hypothetical protein
MQREGVIFVTVREAFPGKSVHVVPWWRRILGDQEIAEVGFPLDYPAAKKQRALELFPEVSFTNETNTVPKPD